MFKQIFRASVSVLSILVILWNIFGWTVLEMAIEHDHHDEKSYCTIAYCTCEVEDGVSMCTCHHHELRAKGHDADHINNGLHISDDEHVLSYCSFEVPHSKPKDTLTVAPFSEIKAFFQPLEIEPSFTEQPELKHYMPVYAGTSHLDDLFRPPQV